jgi:cholest-4-en-3-one 26-monooxygenase
VAEPNIPPGFDFTDQWELFKTGRPDTAADEIVRWATPVTVFQRTALADTTLGGQQIRAGQRVGLFYRSANFDEEIFDHPERFDIHRSPNPHLGFGGSGRTSASVQASPGWRST